jgi:hypothetical protein
MYRITNSLSLSRYPFDTEGVSLRNNLGSGIEESDKSSTQVLLPPLISCFTALRVDAEPPKQITLSFP